MWWSSLLLSDITSALILKPCIVGRLNTQLRVAGCSGVLSAPITNSNVGQQSTARPRAGSHLSRQSSVTLTRGLNLQPYFISSQQCLPHLGSALPTRPSSFWSFSFPKNDLTHRSSPSDITQPDKSRECAQFTFVFISHPVAQNQAVLQWHNCAANCWQWLDIMHSGTVEKLGCCQRVFPPYWNIRLS